MMNASNSLDWLTSYNTWVVLGGVAVLGANAGMVGTFAVLRGRSLMGDALAHAALPGVCLGFWVAGGRAVGPMLLGALLTGCLGLLVLAFLKRWTRLPDDAGLGVVLSVFFGVGVVMSRLIQNNAAGGAKAGLESYILGKTAGILMSDLLVIAVVALISALLVGLMFKEFLMVAFDEGFARAVGLPTTTLDLAMTSLTALTVIVGLPAVGVVMMAALLIIPAASARLWSDRLEIVLLVAASLGAVASASGALTSAALNLPAGPTVVLSGAGLFLLSLLLAPRRGLLTTRWRAWCQTQALNITDPRFNRAMTRAFFERHPQMLNDLEDLNSLRLERLLSPEEFAALAERVRLDLVREETREARS